MPIFRLGHICPSGCDPFKDNGRDDFRYAWHSLPSNLVPITALIYLTWANKTKGRFGVSIDKAWICSWQISPWANPRDCHTKFYEPRNYGDSMTSNRGKVPYRSFRAWLALACPSELAYSPGHRLFIFWSQITLSRSDWRTGADPGREKVADKQKRVARGRIHRFVCSLLGRQWIPITGILTYWSRYNRGEYVVRQLRGNTSCQTQLRN